MSCTFFLSYAKPRYWCIASSVSSSDTSLAAFLYFGTWFSPRQPDKEQFSIRISFSLYSEPRYWCIDSWASSLEASLVVCLANHMHDSVRDKPIRSKSLHPFRLPSIQTRYWWITFSLLSWHLLGSLRFGGHMIQSVMSQYRIMPCPHFLFHSMQNLAIGLLFPVVL